MYGQQWPGRNGLNLSHPEEIVRNVKGTVRQQRHDQIQNTALIKYYRKI